ncbi:hypothetical protein LJK87_32445 [Paenibacillus sp. P25]|nr:hypothetical protein LJK87_32445 [Paenibacillus sp. P25]
MRVLGLVGVTVCDEPGESEPSPPLLLLLVPPPPLPLFFAGTKGRKIALGRGRIAAHAAGLPAAVAALPSDRAFGTLA